MQDSNLGLVVPIWPLRPWWCDLVEVGGSSFLPVVKACIVLPNMPDLVTPGPSYALDTWRRPSWRFMAVLLDFSGQSWTKERVPVPLEARHLI